MEEKSDEIIKGRIEEQLRMRKGSQSPTKFMRKFYKYEHMGELFFIIDYGLVTLEGHDTYDEGKEVPRYHDLIKASILPFVQFLMADKIEKDREKQKEQMGKYLKKFHLLFEFVERQVQKNFHLS